MGFSGGEGCHVAKRKRHVLAFPPQADRAGEGPQWGPLWPDRVGRRDAKPL